MSFVDSLGDVVSDAFKYLNENEWAANMVAGAAAGAGEYYRQKDQQKHDLKMLRKQKQMGMTQVGDTSYDHYERGLTNGILTNGVLAKGKKR